MNQIKERLLRIFNENGITIEEDNLDRKLDLDSLNYISIIVAIEKEFGINLDEDDEFFNLGYNNPSFNDILNYSLLK